MLLSFMGNKCRALATKWAIPPLIIILISLIADSWIVINNISTAGWLLGKMETWGWHIPEVRHVNLWVAIANIGLFVGLIWLTFLFIWPRNTGVMVRAGRVRAVGEVWNPFRMSERDPRITLEFDEANASFGKHKQFTAGKIYLCNDGGTDAFNVKPAEIRLQSGTAEFGEIAHIRNKQKAQAAIRILEPSKKEPGKKHVPYAVHDLTLLLTAETKLRPDSLDFSPLETKCHINYEDYAKRRFITHAILSLDVLQGRIIAKDYTFFELRLATPPKFIVRLWLKLRGIFR